MPARGPLLLGGLWAASAALAVGVGLVAVDLVAGEVGEDVASPLSDEAVRGALGTANPSPSRATPSATPSRHAEPDADDGPLRTITTTGGVVSARCHEAEPRLVYASPAEGYRTDRSGNELVRFESSRRTITVRLSCDGRQLVSSTRTDEHDEPSATPKPATRSPQPSPTESSDDDHSESPRPEESESSSPGSGDSSED